MKIQQKFNNFFLQYLTHSDKRRFLLAVSGGVDSMVLADLFSKHNFRFQIAHCNFKLRGAESDADQAFAELAAKKYGVTFHTVSFDTEEYAKEKKISIQEAARELRYEWLEKIRVQEKMDYLVTAHHADDQAETILYNFIKGTGIRGLRGMLAKRDKLIRPLLHISKAELQLYSKENDITYREDSSNKSDKYSRNKIRNEIIPLIEIINPSFRETLLGQQQIYGQLEIVYQRTIAKEKQKLFVKVTDDEYRIPILLLKKSPIALSLLHEFLSGFGFNKSQCEDILEGLNSGLSGKQFFSETHCILRDRKFLILTKPGSDENTFYHLDISGQKGALKVGKYLLEWSIISRADLKINPSKSFCYLDLKGLKGEMIIRHWRKGDYFYPFGMKRKKKKVSKFFKDEKMSISDKDKIWMLQCGERIVWVMNHRSDERFKVTDKTGKILELKVTEQ